MNPRAALLVAVFTLLVGGCVSATAPEGASKLITATGGSAAARLKSAIETVLAQDKVLTGRMSLAIGNTSVSDAQSTAIAQYVFGLKSLDMSECPQEFREAYLRHMQAWQRYSLKLASEPSTHAGRILGGAMNALTKGEIDGGATRMEKEYKDLYEAMQRSWEEVETIAVKYGARLHPVR